MHAGDGVGAASGVLSAPEIPRAFPSSCWFSPLCPGPHPRTSQCLSPTPFCHWLECGTSLLPPEESWVRPGDHKHPGKPQKQVCHEAGEGQPGSFPGVTAPGQSFSFVSFKLMGNHRKSHSDFQRLLLDIPQSTSPFIITCINKFMAVIREEAYYVIGLSLMV